MRQCSTATGTPAWFAPPPSDVGAISATWWVLGFGNRFESDPTNGVSVDPIDGDGFIDTPNPGLFIGVDSANLTAGPANGESDGGLDLIDALIGTGHPQSAGGLCFSAAANWALPFVDGCSDMNRTFIALGNSGDVSDDYLNPYFYDLYGPGTFTDAALLDAPMGVLLTESSNKYFALGFFSATNRGGDPNDIFDRGYDMGAIVNGDPNPAVSAGNNNIIPWQAIPLPHVSTAIDPNNDDRILSVNWPMIRLVHDDSSRLNSSQYFDPTAQLRVLGRDRNGNDLIGVGILEMPELVSYAIEKKPITGALCDPNTPWVEAGPRVVPPITTATGTHLSTSVTVPPDTCIRLVTHVGRYPSASFLTAPTLTNRNLNRRDSQLGNLGDLGYSVTHAQGVRMIGGPLLGDAAILRRAAFERMNLVIEFETFAELGVQSYEITARRHGHTTSLVTTVECSQCSTGVGATYTIAIAGRMFRDAQTIFVVARPSGRASNELTITRSRERPGAADRSGTGARR